MAGAKMSWDKMTNRMTKHFRFNSLGKLTDGINLTDRINLTDDYKTSLRLSRGKLATSFLLLNSSHCSM